MVKAFLLFSIPDECEQGRAEADSLLRAHGIALRERDEAAALFEDAMTSLRETEQVGEKSKRPQRSAHPMKQHYLKPPMIVCVWGGGGDMGKLLGRPSRGGWVKKDSQGRHFTFDASR